MRHTVFSVAIGCASQTLLVRDGLLGLPRKPAADDGSVTTRHAIPSDGNMLDAVLVKPPLREPSAGMLICHGIGETVGHWRAAQGLLARLGVASLVFDYSGYGRSTGRIDAMQCERDTVHAFRFLAAACPGVRVSLLGFSLGSGIATAVVTETSPAGLILCAAFPSLREAAARLMPRMAARALPDIWNTEERLRRCSVPVLLVQGEADWLFPVRMAQRLADACAGPHELRSVPELTHNAPIYRPSLNYWEGIAGWIRA